MKCMEWLISIVLAAALLTLYVPVTARADGAEDISMSGYSSLLYNNTNGLPTSEANAIVQSDNGFIYIGSYSGLIRYDGTEFRNFSSEGILPSSSVRMMFEDSADRLWIGTNDAGVFVYENGEISQPEGQPRDNFLCVRGFAEDGSGTVYACSNSGIAEIRDGVMTVYDIDELTGRTVYSVAADKFGRIWGAESSGGCAVLKDGKLVKVVSGETFLGDGLLSDRPTLCSHVTRVGSPDQLRC